VVECQACRLWVGGAGTGKGTGSDLSAGIAPVSLARVARTGGGRPCFWAEHPPVRVPTRAWLARQCESRIIFCAVQSTEIRTGPRAWDKGALIIICLLK